MLKHFKLTYFAIFCWLWGCTPGFSPVQWDALNYDELSERINNPTGEVSLASIGEVSDELVILNASAMGFNETLTTAVTSLNSEPSSQEGGLVGTRHGGLDGTNVYLKAACPGADLSNPTTNMSGGFVRIDSPNLSEESLSTGGLLVEFSDCVVGDLFMNGVCIAHYNDDPFSFGLSLDLFVSYQDFELKTFAEMIYTNGQFQALVTLNDETTLAVEASFSDGLSTFTLSGSNGSFSCAQDAAGSISCDGL